MPELPDLAVCCEAGEYLVELRALRDSTLPGSITSERTRSLDAGTS